MPTSLNAKASLHSGQNQGDNFGNLTKACTHTQHIHTHTYVYTHVCMHSLTHTHTHTHPSGCWDGKLRVHIKEWVRFAAAGALDPET